VSFSVKKVIEDAAHSARLFSMALLAVAVILGAYYRFNRIERWDLSGDEGTAWAGAIAPSVAAVIVAEPRIENGGKLPPYDLLLHGWIGVFGDSVASMRRLSAVIGTVVIVLVFVAVREVFRSLGDESAGSTGELAGAFAALIYATNLMMVVSDRTAREFPLLLASELLQIIFFVRAQRRGTLADCIGTALLTAAMIAINYSSSFLLCAEALWLSCLLTARWAGARASRPEIVRPGVAVTAGVALLAPLLPMVFADSALAVRMGAVNWIKVQPISWPFTTLCDSANSPALFWVFAVLGIFGIWRHWRSARFASFFCAVWMAGPLLAAFAVTYLIRPMEFPRYVLIAFLGMFALAGQGAAALRSAALRIALVLLIVGLSSPAIHYWLRNYHELGWREAASLASRETALGDQIAVYNRYKVNVVRYYLASDRRTDVVSMGDQCGSARVLIIGGFGGATAADLATAQKCYPRLLARVHAVEVRTR
jgi:hypothetical protein